MTIKVKFGDSPNWVNRSDKMRKLSIYFDVEWVEDGHLPLEWISEEPTEYLVRCTYQAFKDKCEEWS